MVPASHEAAVTGTEGVLQLAEEYFEYAPLQDWQDNGPGDLSGERGQKPYTDRCRADCRRQKAAHLLYGQPIDI